MKAVMPTMVAFRAAERKSDAVGKAVGQHRRSVARDRAIRNRGRAAILSFPDLDQPFLHCPYSRFGTVTGFELPKYVLHMLFNRFDADFKRAADFAIRQAKGQVPQHLHLAVGEWDAFAVGRAAADHAWYSALCPAGCPAQAGGRCGLAGNAAGRIADHAQCVDRGVGCAAVAEPDRGRSTAVHVVPAAVAERAGRPSRRGRGDGKTELRGLRDGAPANGWLISCHQSAVNQTFVARRKQLAQQLVQTSRLHPYPATHKREPAGSAASASRKMPGAQIGCPKGCLTYNNL
jgi:hypothetical protein